MTAYKCDICGELFESKEKLKIKKDDDAEITINLPYCTNAYDICPNCINSIQEIIDKRREQNERSNV